MVIRIVTLLLTIACVGGLLMGRKDVVEMLSPLLGFVLGVLLR